MPSPQHQNLNSKSWRLATFPVRVSSPQQSLTSVFGMRTGITSATNHQLLKFKLLRWFWCGASRNASDLSIVYSMVTNRSPPKLCVGGRTGVSRINFYWNFPRPLLAPSRSGLARGAQPALTPAIRHQNLWLNFKESITHWTMGSTIVDLVCINGLWGKIQNHYLGGGISLENRVSFTVPIGHQHLAGRYGSTGKNIGKLIPSFSV